MRHGTTVVLYVSWSMKYSSPSQNGSFKVHTSSMGGNCSEWREVDCRLYLSKVKQAESSRCVYDHVKELIPQWPPIFTWSWSQLTWPAISICIHSTHYQHNISPSARTLFRRDLQFFICHCQSCRNAARYLKTWKQETERERDKTQDTRGTRV